MAIRFNLSTISPQSDILSAKIRLYRISVGYNGTKLDTICSVYTPSKDWTNIATWADYDVGQKWDNAGGDFSETPIITIQIKKSPLQTWFEFDVTDAVKEYVKNPSTYKGFIIAIPGGEDVTLEGSLDNNNEMVSSEATDKPDFTPRLEVTFSVTDIAQHNTLMTKQVQNVFVNHGIATIKFKKRAHRVLSLITVDGTVLNRLQRTQSVYSFPVDNASGIYFIKIIEGGQQNVVRVIAP